MNSLSRALWAEFIGTFCLIFFGVGAAVVQAQTGLLGHPGVAAVFGLVVAACIAVFAPVSGAHINPAATLAIALTGKFPSNRVFPYILVQLLSASVASFCLRAMFGLEGNLGTTLPHGPALQSFILETLMTFFLLLVAIRSGLPWIVGSVVGLEALMGGPISGASMNPARSFGPALASGVWTDHWIYWVAPFLGAVIAVGVNRGIGTQESEGDSSSVREFESKELL